MGIKLLYNDNLRKLPNEYGDVSVMCWNDAKFALIGALINFVWNILMAYFCVKRIIIT